MTARIFLTMAFILLSWGCSSSTNSDTAMLNPHPAWAAWDQTHSTEFIKNPDGCATCHGSTSDPLKSGGQARTSCFACHNHSTNAPCADCHLVQQKLWASNEDLHSASTVDVLTNADHNAAELLTDSCLKCHSTFDYPRGVAHFVTPLNQAGQPMGTWTALNSGDWHATKCEVCHDPYATNADKLAKYGSVLDGPWSAGYTNATKLPDAYQTVIAPSTGAVSTFTYADQTTLAVQATKLCNSCHDPADQGGDPNISVGGIDFGPQGGDSRAFVTTSHQGLGCINCHATHDFTPSVPETTPSCAASACHSSSKVGTLPGKVHVNHL